MHPAGITTRFTTATGMVLLMGILGLNGCRSPDSEELRRLRVAYPSVADVEDVPSFMAHRLLEEAGYAVSTTFFSQSELAVAALTRGDVDFSVGSGRTLWQAIAQGAPLVTVVEHAANGWVILSRPEIRSCEDLARRRFAQHGEGTVSKAMSDAYILENCPGTEPEYLIIPGSANRAAALIAGEVDAATMKIAEAVEIGLRHPNRYQVLVNFAQDLPMLQTTDVYANRNFVRTHPEAVRDYIRALLRVHRKIAANPDLLLAEVPHWVTLDDDVLPAVLEGQFEVNTWDVNGGIDISSIRFSLDFFTRAGKLPAGLTVEQVADLSYLDQVLDEMGRR